MDKKITNLKTTLVKTLKANGVIKAGIFGSYARGESKKGSDVDIIVQPKKGTSLYDLVGLELEIKSLLKKNVDLVTYKSLHPLLKDKILKDEVRIIN